MNRPFRLNLKISVWTLVIWLILVILGAKGMVIYCYGIMFLHECSHVLTALFLGCEVENVTVYPFGLCAKIQNTHSLSLSQRILLYGAGPFVHLLIVPVLTIMLQASMISYVMYEYLMQINVNYLLFNLFPVFPLDGYQLMNGVLMGVFPYRTALKISRCFSVCSLLLLWKVRPAESFIYLLCLLMLLIMNVIGLLHLHREIYDFYLLRFLSEKKWKNKVHSWKDIFVYRTNWIMENGAVFSEKELLKKILKLEGK